MINEPSSDYMPHTDRNEMTETDIEQHEDIDKEKFQIEIASRDMN